MSSGCFKSWRRGEREKRQKEWNLPSWCWFVSPDQIPIEGTSRRFDRVRGQQILRPSRGKNTQRDTGKETCLSSASLYTHNYSTDAKSIPFAILATWVTILLLLHPYPPRTCHLHPPLPSSSSSRSSPSCFLLLVCSFWPGVRENHHRMALWLPAFEANYIRHLPKVESLSC